MRSGLLSLGGSIVVLLSGACGARVVVDGDAGGTGGSFGGTTSTSTASGIAVGGASSVGTAVTTATSGSTSGGGGSGAIQVPTGTPSDCAGVVYDLVMSLEGLIGCTPFAPGTQCSGAFYLHDPCGCLHIINESTEDGNATNVDSAYDQCVAMGCCGPALQGCGPCLVPPPVGHCDGLTSQCVNGP